MQKRNGIILFNNIGYKVQVCETKICDWDKIQSMNEWYHKYLGRKLLNAERYFLDKIMPKFWGYYLVQLGGPSDYDFLSNAEIPNKLRVNPEDLAIGSNFIRAEFEALPFLPDSIDAIVVAHVLEFVRNPRLVLAEVHSALTAKGSMVILGFNPFSLWGIMKLFKRHKIFPWDGRFISMWRMRRWLEKLGFEIVERRTCCFNVPLGNYYGLNIPRFLATILRFLLPWCGASYILVCKKRVIALTPIKDRLLRRRISAIESPTVNIAQSRKYEES